MYHIKNYSRCYIDKEMKKKDFCELTGMSYSTLRKLSHGENVQVSVLDNICTKMHCQLNDIAEVLEDTDVLKTDLISTMQCD